MKRLILSVLMVIAATALYAYETTSPQLGSTQSEAASNSLEYCSSYWNRACKIDKCWQDSNGMYLCTSRTIR